ncbi:MAG: PrgI family protein [Eubacteriales bacterium]|nr:PrgI family protein [Eubacteriales bacterium]
MAYVNVPNDLSRIKTKMAFNLTKRQLICFGAAAAIGIPTYLLARSAIGGTGAMLLMIALMLPCFFLAMYERDGLPAEKVLKNILRATVLTPRVRPYQTQNFYLYLSNHGKEVQPIDRKKGKTARQRP